MSESEICWRQISNHLLEIRSTVATPNYQTEEFRLRIFLNSVAPNIRALQRKRNVASQKFTQIQMLLGTLFSPQHTGEHPASALNDIESIISTMERSQGWWRTNFATDLRQAVELEWLPILIDNRLSEVIMSLYLH